jgi:hypothetical protein
VPDRDGRKVDALDATDVDGSHGIALRVRTFAVRMHATDRAEPVLDGVLVERVAACRIVGREEMKLLPWNEPEQRTLALADRAVARQGALDLAFHLECDPAAVAASLVVHCRPSEFRVHAGQLPDVQPRSRY